MSSENKRIKNVIESIDKRVGYFECIDGKYFFSEKVPALLGTDGGEWDKMMSDPALFRDFLSDITLGTKPDSGDGTEHCFGIIDDDKKYVIVHAFFEENGVYGYVVDKTSDVRRVIEVKAELEAVRKRSATDPLTGLPNRDGFEDYVNKALSLCPNQGALIIMDMDNFKLVNDMLGHPVGDKVLKQFAAVVTEHFSGLEAAPGRIGGDEFVVFISENISNEKLADILGSFIEKVRESFAEEYPEQKLSSSVGAFIAGTGVSDYASLYKSADSALYTVKKNGKNAYHIG